MKSELAILRDKWFESEEGKTCANVSTLTCGIGNEDKFLRNRLEAAFLAGAKANEEAQEIIAKKLLLSTST